MVNKLNRFPVLFDISPSGGATVPFENAFFIPTALSATFLISCCDRVTFPLSLLSLSSDNSMWPEVSQSAPASDWAELCRVQVWGCSWLGPAKALFDKSFFKEKIYLYPKRIPYHVAQYMYVHIYRILHFHMGYRLCVLRLGVLYGSWAAFSALKENLQSYHFVSHLTDSGL